MTITPVTPAVLLCVLLSTLAGSAAAQSGSSMEQRLRTQLQATHTQLQQAQAELARLRVAQAPVPVPVPAADPAEVTRLRAELKQLQARQQAGDPQLRSLRGQLADTEQRLQVQQQTVQQLRQQGTAAEKQQQGLAASEGEVRGQLQQCVQRNAALYAIGQEVLSAYEQLGVGGALRRRQPFAAQSRARFEALAQAQGDRLYENRVNAQPLPAAGQGAEAASKAAPTSP